MLLILGLFAPRGQRVGQDWGIIGVRRWVGRVCVDVQQGSGSDINGPGGLCEGTRVLEYPFSRILALPAAFPLPEFGLRSVSGDPSAHCPDGHALPTSETECTSLAHALTELGQHAAGAFRVDKRDLHPLGAVTRGFVNELNAG